MIAEICAPLQMRAKHALDGSQANKPDSRTVSSFSVSISSGRRTVRSQ